MSSWLRSKRDNDEDGTTPIPAARSRRCFRRRCGTRKRIASRRWAATRPTDADDDATWTSSPRLPARSTARQRPQRPRAPAADAAARRQSAHRRHAGLPRDEGREQAGDALRPPASRDVEMARPAGRAARPTCRAAAAEGGVATCRPGRNGCSIAAMLVWTRADRGRGLVRAARQRSGSASAAGRGVRAQAQAAVERPRRKPGQRVPSARRRGAAATGGDGRQYEHACRCAPRRRVSLQPVPAHARSAGRGVHAQRRSTRRAARGAAHAPASKGVIVLDPGHGRGDPGAVHYLPDGSGAGTSPRPTRICATRELIRDDLVALGYEVYLTRNGEGQGPGAPLPLQFITSDLYARVGLAKAVDADLYLAIHGNGASVPFLSGPETWYCGRHEEGAANEKLATLVQQAMMDALHEYGYFPPDRGIKEDAQSHHSGDFCQFVVTRETPVPAALLEFLFLSNDDDAKVLVDDRVARPDGAARRRRASTRSCRSAARPVRRSGARAAMRATLPHGEDRGARQLQHGPRDAGRTAARGRRDAAGRVRDVPRRQGLQPGDRRAPSRRRGRRGGARRRRRVRARCSSPRSTARASTGKPSSSIATAGTGVASIIVEPDGTNTIVQAPRANRNVSPDDIRARGADAGGGERRHDATGDIDRGRAGVRRGSARRRRSDAAQPGAGGARRRRAAVADRHRRRQRDRGGDAQPRGASTAWNRRSPRQTHYARAGRPSPRSHSAAVGRSALRRVTRVREPAVRVDVVDTVGAGDAFCAALAVAAGRGRRIRRCDALRERRGRAGVHEARRRAVDADAR